MQMMDTYRVEELAVLFREAREIGIVTHTHPDGDAMGSTLALYHFLSEKMGKKAYPVIPDSCPSSLDFIVPEGVVADAGKDSAGVSRRLSSCDLIVCLDLNTFSRTAVLESTLRESSVPKVLIDHHLNPDRDCFKLVFSDTEVSSTCELLYHILMHFPGISDASELPAGTAAALMTGMTTDTNNFANSVFPSTLAMASSLLAAGVDRDGIVANLYNEYRENRVRAMGYILSELLHITDDGVAYFVFRREDWKRFGLEEGETEGFVNLPLSIGRVKISIFMKEDDGFFRVSIRSKKGVSANRLAAAYFNGGGHECASGGRLYFPGDISSRGRAEKYIEEVAARFLQNKNE